MKKKNDMTYLLLEEFKNWLNENESYKNQIEQGRWDLFFLLENRKTNKSFENIQALKFIVNELAFRSEWKVVKEWLIQEKGIIFEKDNCHICEKKEKNKRRIESYFFCDECFENLIWTKVEKEMINGIKEEFREEKQSKVKFFIKFFYPLKEREEKGVDMILEWDEKTGEFYKHIDFLEEIFSEIDIDEEVREMFLDDLKKTQNRFYLWKNHQIAQELNEELWKTLQSKNELEIKLTNSEKELNEEKKKNELLTQELKKYLGSEELVVQVLQETNQQLNYWKNNK